MLFWDFLTCLGLALYILVAILLAMRWRAAREQRNRQARAPYPNPSRDYEELNRLLEEVVKEAEEKRERERQRDRLEILLEDPNP